MLIELLISAQHRGPQGQTHFDSLLAGSGPALLPLGFSSLIPSP